MKNIYKNILCLFSFVFALFIVSDFRVNAKSSSNEVFEIIVGDNNLPLYYVLVENQVVYNELDQEVGNLESNIISMNNGYIYTINNNNVYVEGEEEIIGSLNEDVITMNNGDVYTLGEISIKERIQFNVYVKGKVETLNEYKWEHKLCYKIEGYNEICEIDITGEDSSSKITSQGEYSYYFYDGHMPYYSETLIFEYVIFKNKFICIDCESNNEFSLVDIKFSKDEIDYTYNYDMSVEFREVNGKKYIGDDTNVSFVNNSASRLNYTLSPTYNFIYEVCVEEGKCVRSETDKVYSGGVSYSITPYIGNINFSFDISDFINEDITYEKATYRIILKCIGENCSSRRIIDNFTIEKGYYLDYRAPKVDENNTIINASNDEVKYVKNSNVKITLNENESGLNKESLKYYIIKPAYNSCYYYSNVDEYTFANGEVFSIGDGLNGGYCMYYTASDNYGNKFTSSYYVFYFDNKGPVMEFENTYDSSKYYNEIILNPTFNDTYSDVKEVYYLWSKDIVSEENYINIKNEGKVYSDGVSSNELIDDGVYHLYMLAIDNLDNYSFNDLGIFNLDRTGLSINDIVIETNELNEKYSNTFTIKLSISEMEDNGEFKCGFFMEDNVSVNELINSCYNNQIITLPTGLEGIYNLFVNVKDRANNYSLLKVVDKVKIDTKAPSVSYNILYDDDDYHLVNEVTIEVIDLSGINETSLKYGWFLVSDNNILSSSLTNNFVSGVSFGYPLNSYGEYKLYVSAVDNLGNEVFMSIDKVFKVDTDIIDIDLIGEENITILRGEKYNDLGAVAYKGNLINGNRVSEVKVEGEVDTNKPGVYYITYSSGEGNLLVSVKRKVIVKSDNIYVVIGISMFALVTVITSLRLFIRRKKK